MSLEIITLKDDQSGARARITPGFGFNCFSLEVPRGGATADVLWAAPQFEEGKAKASSSGIPILFPFPGRIREGKYQFEEREYTLPATDGRGNAIHGFVLDRPWQVVESSERRVVGCFQASHVDARVLQLWPSDFKLTVTYSLAGTTLDMAINVANCGTEPLPCGFGIHPYFRVPLAACGSLDTCRITVPARSYWELENILPTGARLPVDESRRLQGANVADVVLDDVLGGLEFHDGKATGLIEDTASGSKVEITFDDTFRACVVYTPPHREAICIEPYTCVPDPFTLIKAGIDAGLRVLEPGESFDARVSIRTT